MSQNDTVAIAANDLTPCPEIIHWHFLLKRLPVLAQLGEESRLGPRS
jgi:hypothetical protein